MFSSMTSMRLESALVLKQFAGQFHGFGDSCHRNFAAPRPDYPLPRRAIGHLFQYLEYHNARAFEGRFAVADLRIGYDVFAEFQAIAFAICLRFHAVILNTATEEMSLQARA